MPIDIHFSNIANSSIKKYVKESPSIDMDFILSGNSKIVLTPHLNWYIIHITARMFDGYSNISILRSQENITFQVTHAGEGLPGSNIYIFKYYGEIKITNVSQSSLTINVSNFGYITNNVWLGKDNNYAYGVFSFYIL